MWGTGHPRGRVGWARPAASRHQRWLGACLQGGASSAGDRRMAWNNSQPMPAATRGKLSAAMKQKWKDPEHRAAVSGKLKVRAAADCTRLGGGACKADARAC